MCDSPDFEDEAEEDEDKDERDDDDRSPQVVRFATLRLDHERARHQQVSFIGRIHLGKIGVIKCFSRN